MMIETVEMETEKDENQTSENLTAAQEDAPAENVNLTDSFSSELAQPIWSVVSFEEVAVTGLNYDDAVEWVKKLKAQNISGLCIVTDEAARRVTN